MPSRARPFSAQVTHGAADHLVQTPNDVFIASMLSIGERTDQLALLTESILFTPPDRPNDTLVSRPGKIR